MKNKRLADSFNFALKGIAATFKRERNFKIHCFIAAAVLVLCLCIDLDANEFLIVLLAICFVLAAELINTAVEAAVDLICGEKREALAGLAKDAAAGAVFIAAFFAAVTGYILIFSKLLYADFLYTIRDKIKEAPVYLTLICILAVVFVSIAAKVYTRAEHLIRGGMPSVHAALAFCAATCVLFFTDYSVAVYLSFLLALLVAQSRVEGKIHSLLQVALGSLIGIFATIIIFQLFFSV